MAKHTDFILSPISDILQDVVSANKGVGNGIETYPLSEYILQSAFLKMTGAQEQKMKCICWDLATEDFDYRYTRFSLNRLGECSNYKEKNTVYLDVLGALKKLTSDFNVRAALDRDAIVTGTRGTIDDLFSGVNVATWAEKTYLEFLEDPNVLPVRDIATNEHLLSPTLVTRYQLLYDHRNRCAHNTLSTQENLPTLNNLFKSDHRYDNYFIRFALLVLIDKIFIELYEKYLLLMHEN